MRIQKNAVIKADTEVAPEATELVFEASDVAELLSEVTGEDVTVEADDTGDAVTFTVGEDEFLVEADGDEEILEASCRTIAHKTPVTSTTRTVKRTANK